MAKTLDLVVKLKALDKLSAPLKAMGAAMDSNQKKLKELQKTSKDLASYRKLNAQLRENQQAMKKLDGSAQGSQKQLKKLQNAQEKLRNNMQTLRSVLRQAGVDTQRLGTEARRLKSNEDALTSTLKRQAAVIATVNKARGGLTATSKGLSAAGKLSHKAGAMSALHGGAAMYGGIRAGQAAMNFLQPGIAFGEQISELQAVARLTNDNPLLEAMKTQARQLGASTAFTATEAAGAQTFLARAGFTPQAILSSMQDVLELALANGADLARTADIASNISGAFKIDPEVEGNMRRVADVLSGVSARANVDLEMLGETMKYMGKAEGLDISLEQAAAMAGLLGNIGIQGSMAGTTMRAMMDRITAPAAEGRKALEGLGLSATDGFDNLRNIEDIISDVAWATEKMGNVEQAKVLKDIFGTQAGSGMAELIKQQGSGALGKLVKELKSVNGENAQMAKTRSDNLAGDIKNLGSAWEEVGIALTETNKGPLRENLQMLTDIVRKMGEWVGENQQQVVDYAKLAAKILAVVTAGGALLLLLAPLFMGISMIATVLAGLVSTVGFAAKAIPFLVQGLVLFIKVNLLIIKGAAALVAGIKALIGIVITFGKVALFWGRMLIMANPMAALIVAIVALVAAAIYLWRNWDTLGPKLKAIWDSIYTGIGEALAGIVNFFTGIWSELKAAWGNGWLDFSLTIGRMLLDWNPLGLLYTAFAKIVNYFGGQLPETFSDAGKAIINGLKEGILSLLPDLTGIMDKLGGLLPDSLKTKLGIHSPSRVFAELGENTMEGYNQGLESEQGYTIAQLSAFGKKVAATAAGVTLTGAVAASPMGASQGINNQSQGDTITINVYAQQGQSAQDIAAEIERVLNQRQRRQAIRQNSRLGE